MSKEQSHHPVLPRLKEDGSVSNLNEAGKWLEREADEIYKVSESLKVEKIELDINSIPDMWARPLLFEMALFDHNHLLHKRIVGEWRGLLALLALKEVRGISALNVKEVNLPVLDKNAAAPEENTTPSFLHTLSKLVPNRSLSRDTSWNKLYVLLFNAKPIGMTSPTTLVATATDYFDRIHNVPWYGGRYLEDPTGKLADQQRKYLAGWLAEVIKGLNSHPWLERQGSEWRDLSQRLTVFKEELIGSAEISVTLSERTSMGMLGIFEYIGKPVESRNGDAAESHVLLRSSRTSPPEKKILVVDPSIATQWRMQAHDIVVWGGAMLDTESNAYSSTANQRHLIGGVPHNHLEKWKPEDFFTEKLFVINQENAFPGANRPKGADYLTYQGDVVTPILPLNKELLAYLTPEQLANRFHFEQSGDDIIAKLFVPLSGPTGVGKDFLVSKVFSAKNESIAYPISSPPVLEVWPNFKTQDGSWKAYFTYYNNAGEESFFAQPYPASAETGREEFKNKRGEIERFVTQMNIFPEAMICQSQTANPDTKKMETTEAGVILLDQPDDLPTQTKTYRVGIDFGATNTNVYAREGANEPVAIKFEKRFLQVTASGQKRTDMYFHFLPGEQQETPFQSLFQDFQHRSVSAKDRGQEIRPLLDGHIYYLLDYKAFQSNAPGIAADLKWSVSDEDRNRAQAFLLQLCLQAAAEVAAKQARHINWAYSFPTAFPTKLRQGFPQTWMKITQACSELTGLTKDAELTSKTESMSSALFFKNYENASTATGTVCIDIGGSTSDIAIWQKNNMCWQTSLKMAGRDMFLNLLRANPDFLSLCKFVPDVSGLKAVQGNRAAFYAKTDAIINKEGDQWLNQLPNHAGKEEVQQFAQLIAIGLSGIFYYVGLLLKYLVAQGKYERQIPNIYVGGNGSRLFHWLDAGKYTQKSPINNLFKEMLLRASGFEGQKEDFKIRISSIPKAEAAYGLVCDDKLKFEQDGEQGVLVGESFLENGEEQNWDQLLSATMLQQGLSLPEAMPGLDDFLKTFNDYTASQNSVIPKLKVDKNLLREIRSQIVNELLDLKGVEDAESINVEPIFILAVKSLLEIKTEDWAA
ncbi:MAG: hypothetical protein HY231_05890 [Acidobacteria bacterium]|nr:hypothetical protein [Acidobacteriota bacterium]